MEKKENNSSSPHRIEWKKGRYSKVLHIRITGNFDKQQTPLRLVIAGLYVGYFFFHLFLYFTV